MTLLINVISGIRNVRGEMNIAPSMALNVYVRPADPAARKTVAGYQELIVNLARLESLTIMENGKRPSSSATTIVDGATIFVALGGIIDFNKESERLEKELVKVSDELASVSRKLENEDFLSKAPSDVVAKVKERHAGLLEKHQKLQSHLDRIRSIEAP